jgi:hypothetical protein
MNLNLYDDYFTFGLTKVNLILSIFRYGYNAEHNVLNSFAFNEIKKITDQLSQKEFDYTVTILLVLLKEFGISEITLSKLLNK